MTSPRGAARRPSSSFNDEGHLTVPLEVSNRGSEYAADSLTPYALLHEDSIAKSIKRRVQGSNLRRPLRRATG